MGVEDAFGARCRARRVDHVGRIFGAGWGVVAARPLLDHAADVACADEPGFGREIGHIYRICGREESCAAVFGEEERFWDGELVGGGERDEACRQRAEEEDCVIACVFEADHDAAAGHEPFGAEGACHIEDRRLEIAEGPAFDGCVGGEASNDDEGHFVWRLTGRLANDVAGHVEIMRDGGGHGGRRLCCGSAGFRPPGVEGETEQRRGFWMLKRLPVGDPLGGRVEKRDDVVAREQHSVKGSHGGDELVLAACGEQGADHGIHRLALDARVIVGARLIADLGRPAEKLLVAGREERTAT